MVESTTEGGGESERWNNKDGAGANLAEQLLLVCEIRGLHDAAVGGDATARTSDDK